MPAESKLPPIRQASFLTEARELSQLPPPVYAEVAFAGRSNVGKSSLLNCLLQRRSLARTSRTPGATRGLVVLRVEVGAAIIDLVDLPGYGYAKRSKAERAYWGGLIEGFLRERPGLRAVLVLVDLRRGMEEDEAQLIEFVKELGRKVIVVATKTDKIPLNKRKLALKALQQEVGVRVYGVSAPTGDGRDKLWAAVLRAAGVELTSSGPAT